MIVRVGSTTVEIDEQARRVTTTFADGRQVVAAPVQDAESRERAKALGYESVWAMTRDHDLAHSPLAQALGQDRSRTLDAVAGGDPVSDADADLEERVVLLLQRVSNLGLRGIV